MEMPTILIVDDDVEVAKQLKWSFHDQFQIVHALSRQEIERCLATHHPVAALVDMHLPPTIHTPETGLMHVKWLRGNHPNLLVIGISVSLDATIPEELRSAGASSFLNKPFTNEALRKALASVL